MIDILTKLVKESRDNSLDSWNDLLDGIGDDCAVWRGDAHYQLAKVDCQVQGVHFNLDIISWEDLGWKSLAVNLSDIASMGGVPRYALVSLGLPLDTEVEAVVSLYRGMLELAGISGIAIAGGNLSGSPMIFVDINLIGRTAGLEGKYLSRSKAVPGDRIAVTGWLGTAAAGLEMLTGKLKPGANIASCLKDAFVRPEPRLAEGRLLVEKGVKVGIDISDGLLSDLGHICKRSGVGAVVEAEKLPIRDEVKSVFGHKSLELALSGGEDYQLLFTAQDAVIESVQAASTYPVTVIGEITPADAGEVTVIDREGRRYIPHKVGWDHFK